MRGKGIFFGGDRAGAIEAEKPATGGCPLRARRGRPCLIAEPERRQLLLDAAESVFLGSGYSSASMDDIARQAGMSKKTLYRLFETKEALFAAVIAARRASLEAAIEEDCSDLRTAEDMLRAYLGRVARFVLAPRQAALYRLVIAESQRAPEIAHAFHREGPSKGRVPLSTWLAHQNQHGTLVVPDPVSAASMLFSMVIADLQMRLLIGEIRAPDDRAIEERVNRAVELFIQGARPRSA